MAEAEFGLLTFELREVALRVDPAHDGVLRIRADAVVAEKLSWIDAKASTFSSAAVELQRSDDGVLTALMGAHDRALVELSRDVIAALANTELEIQLFAVNDAPAGDALVATARVQLLEWLIASNTNLSKRVQLQQHQSSSLQISEDSFVECQLFADAELASFVLGGDFHRCASIDVSALPQAWLEAATPQPPVIEQKFFVELEVGSEANNDGQEYNALQLAIPATEGNLVLPDATDDAEEAAADAGSATPAVHFSSTEYWFAHRADLAVLRAHNALGEARFRLKHVLYSTPDGGDKKKGKKNDAPPIETITYYSAVFKPGLHEFGSPDIVFDLVLERETARKDNAEEEEKDAATETGPEASEDESKTLDQVQVRIVYSTVQIWAQSEETLRFSRSLSEVLPPHTRSRPAKPTRDVEQELRYELKEIISQVATEYTKLFPHNGKLTRDEKKAKLLHHLSVSGIYHTFKEKLKPKVTRVARHKFGPKQQALEATSAAEAGKPELGFDEFLSKLYVHLLNESTSVLNSAYEETVVELEESEVYDGATISEDRETCNQTLARLQRWAADAEAAGRHDYVVKLLMDRVNCALDHRGEDTQVARVAHVWIDLAEFHLRNAQEHSLETAQACLTEAVSAQVTQHNLAMLATTYLEQQSYEKASACLYPEAWAAQSEELQTSTLHPFFFVARCLYFHACNETARAGEMLQAAVKAHLTQRIKPEMHEQGRPRRTAVCVLLQAAQRFAALNCFRLARQAFDLAEQAEDACRVKAQARNMLVEAPAFHLQLMRRMQAALARQRVEVENRVVVETLLREALLFDTSENTRCWVELADFLFDMGNKPQSLDAYKKAINTHGEQSGGSELPLQTFYRTGVMLLESNDYASAQSVFLAGCATYESALLWLGAGVSFLRQEMWNDAEEAIKQASHLDYTNASIWGFYALLCLCSSTNRENEADQSIAQACRLQLADAGLLKELALENIAVGRLHTAEDLLRRALGVLSSSSTGTQKQLSFAQPASKTMLRKLLGDCLSGQHRAADAVDEYQKVASDSSASQVEQIEALSKCVPLLTTLGREEELESVEQSLQMLQSVA